MNKDPMDFIAQFLQFVESEGIYDEYDKEADKMVTSSGVKALIKHAKEFFPDMGGGKAARLMRDLTDDERERSISGNPRIVDMRAEFARRIALNGGRQRIMSDFVRAMEKGDFDEATKLAEDAATLETYDRGLE